MPQPTLPIGLDSFGKLVRYRTPEGEPYLFADKSMLLDDFVRTNDTISLITRPRRFGKTLNLSMLQHFFAAQVGGRLQQVSLTTSTSVPTLPSWPTKASTLSSSLRSRPCVVPPLRPSTKHVKG